MYIVLCIIMLNSAMWMSRVRMHTYTACNVCVCVCVCVCKLDQWVGLQELQGISLLGDSLLLKVRYTYPLSGLVLI